ncbi:hypothetical protein FJ938_05620 [Mesorhizobium sp. B2-4-14]|uniref:hypothetical protein n=1 Tax=Mesorhizobium sp. B2-4-14 TaxID=2589935 RepID=UPI00112D3AD4|nr:hypothetical protein [Mesorhizobium sp. B2-4-14]TPL10185.1 hypothetical protein FJ938_05620 [Mesorhizobium sp. B2-4-14]
MEEDSEGTSQAERWQRQQEALTAPREAIPVYTQKDYSLIRRFAGADDLPETWDEWARLFDATMIERARARRGRYQRVRIRPDLFQAWLDAKSQVASERSRQIYAQEILDARVAARAAYVERSGNTAVADKWPANPIYAHHDYPLLLKLSEVADLPPTWEEWWANFKESETHWRLQGLFATRVRVHAGKFKAWLQANSLTSSEQTRQQYAQQRLDMKRARRAERRAAARAPNSQFPYGEWVQKPQPQPSPWPHRVIEFLAYTLLAVAIGSASIALKDGGRGWSARELPAWPLDSGS